MSPRRNQPVVGMLMRIAGAMLNVRLPRPLTSRLSPLGSDVSSKSGMLYAFVPLNCETSMRSAWWSTAGSVGVLLALSTNGAAQPLGRNYEAYSPPQAYPPGYYVPAPNYVAPPAYAAPYYHHSPPPAAVPHGPSPHYLSAPPVYGAPTYGYRPPPAVPQDVSPYYRGAPQGYVAPAYGYAHPPAVAYAPPEPVLVPLRPRSCGKYRYWNGEYCADARDEPPYLGPKW